MKALTAMIPLLLLAGCAGKTPRTRWTDKTMRVAINPDGIDANNYVRIQEALVASGKWVVVDRGSAYKALRAEQEREHRQDADRFQDREKFSLWGRLLGVGGVIEAHSQCISTRSVLWGSWGTNCHQFLSIVDTNTGEVVATAEDEQSEPGAGEILAPSWEDAVASLNKAYPAKFEPRRDQALDAYRDLASEEAQRQKEKQ